MKKLFLLGCIAMVSLLSFAQNNEGTNDDAARLAMTPYVDPSLNFNNEVCKQLNNKMSQILTKQGLAGMYNQRFIITCNADILSEDIVVTTKEMYQYELGVNFIVGDGIEGVKFAMASQNVKGLGETKAAAYLAAIKKIKPNDPVFQKLIDDGKKKIIEYYNSKCDFIITEAQTLAKQQNYDGAIYKLMSVPDVCKDCYNKCLAAAEPIFQAKIDQEGAALLAEARNIWNAGQDVYAAESAGAVLAQINPQSKAFPEATKLGTEIAKRVKELDKREWDFMVKQHNDEVDIQKAQIKAMRDVGVAYGNHQQPTTYNIRGWF